MRPYERHGRAGRVSDEQSSVRNVGAIPDLLRKETALTRQRLHGVRKLLRDVSPPGGELVVCALAGQQRPGATDAGSVEWPAVRVFPVPVPLIAMPHGTARRVDLERRVDDLHRVHNARIICRAQPEAHERECVQADHQGRWSHRLIRRPVLDRHESVTRGRGIRPIRHRHADVIAVDAVLMRQFRSRTIQPSFDAGVPGVGRLAQIVGCRLVRCRIGQIGGDQQRGDFGCDREGRIARLFFPAILRTHGTIPREKCRRSPHHRPQRFSPARVNDAVTSGEIHQEDGEGRFVHLNAVPVRRAVEPHVLRPMAVRFLCHLEVSQHAPDVLVRAHRDEATGGLHEVSRPHQVVAAQVVVGLGEAPWDRQAGNDPAFHALGFVRA